MAKSVIEPLGVSQEETFSPLLSSLAHTLPIGTTSKSSPCLASLLTFLVWRQMISFNRFLFSVVVDDAETSESV